MDLAMRDISGKLPVERRNDQGINEIYWPIPTNRRVFQFIERARAIMLIDQASAPIRKPAISF